MTIDPTLATAIVTAILGGIGTALLMIYRDLKADRDYWRDIAVASMGHTDKALNVAEKTVDGA